MVFKKTIQSLLLVVVSAATVTTLDAAPFGFSVNVDDDQLYLIDLESGFTNAIGAVGFGSVKGLDFQPGTGVLFGVDSATNQLLTVNAASGAGSAVAPITFDDPNDAGFEDISFTPNGELLVKSEKRLQTYLVDLNTGAGTILDPLPFSLGGQGLAVDGQNRALVADFNDGFLRSGIVDLTPPNPNLIPDSFSTGSVPFVGGGLQPGRVGLDIIGTTLWGLANSDDPLDRSSAQVFSVDIATIGSASSSPHTVGPTLGGGFDSLALIGSPAPPIGRIPAPSVVWLFAIGGLALLGAVKSHAQS